MPKSCYTMTTCNAPHCLGAPASSLRNSLIGSWANVNRACMFWSDIWIIIRRTQNLQPYTTILVVAYRAAELSLEITSSATFRQWGLTKASHHRKGMAHPQRSSPSSFDWSPSKSVLNFRLRIRAPVVDFHCSCVWYSAQLTQPWLCLQKSYFYII